MRQICLVVMFLWTFTGTAFSAPPERIVSLAPSITEILYDLGLGDRIAAVTTFCDYPPQALDKPKIGGFANPSLEAIVAARPDMVVMTDDGNPLEIFERLKKLGISTYVFKAKRLSELPQGIREMGTALGIRNKALKRAERIERVIQDYERKLKTTVHGRLKKAIFIIHPGPLVVAGPGTVIDDVLNLLGLQNIASDAGVRYPKYSIEEVMRRSPDIIFIGKGKMTGENAGNLIKRLRRVEAVQKGRLYYTSESLYRLSPRVTTGILELAGYLGKH
ncbi:MAG: ABC transporter substrate-binding protein [Syntrophales bacterium]|nr:ABC transporter substrate-binding protein [Syntrophales bacterium]